MLKLWHRQKLRETYDPIRFDILRSLNEPDCPICRVQREWMDKFYFWLLIQNYYV